ncbi:hypothetical protein OG579_17100 [Williamsia herbipolensis]|uniref:Head-to-tail adaptor n=1 Tax=Williamsia herbipolensis TaxID=1603258 RepID=A0AAU4K018_9NOCA|nr:hypothetical protein [Williamsia herbipolensis]
MEWEPLIPQDSQATWSAASDADRAAAKATAVTVLHSLSGSVIGLTIRTVRPLPDLDRPSTYRGTGHQAGYVTGLVPSISAIVDGRRVPTSTSITLDGPVHSIESVTVGGDVLDANAYRIDDGARLVRIDGDTWPEQDLTLADDAGGALLVTYKHGIPADPAAQLAAGILALEVLRGAKGDGACRLPPMAKNIARQGITVDIDPVAFLEAGLTGLPYVDQWIRQINPSGLRAQPSIVIPERRRGVRR